MANIEDGPLATIALRSGICQAPLHLVQKGGTQAEWFSTSNSQTMASRARKPIAITARKSAQVPGLYGEELFVVGVALKPG